MSATATEAWAQERKAYPLSAYSAGYDRALAEASKVIAGEIENNLDLLRSFAPDATPELIAHLIRTLGTARGSSGADD